MQPYSFIYQLNAQLGQNIYAMLYDSASASSYTVYNNTVRFFSSPDDISQYNAGTFNISQTTVYPLNSTYISTFSTTPANNADPFLIYPMNNLKITAWFIGNLKMVDNANNYNVPVNMTSSMAGALV